MNPFRCLLFPQTDRWHYNLQTHFLNEAAVSSGEAKRSGPGGPLGMRQMD